MSDQISGRLSPFLRRRRLAAVEPYLSVGRILDYGCGVGTLAARIPPERYLGVELDAESLASARERFPSHTFLSLDQFERDGSAERFDTVIALALIEHLDDPAGWLRAMKGHLQPQGRIVLTTPKPSLRKVHEWGAKLGLFSREAADEHKTLIGSRLMTSLATTAGLRLSRYRPFLMGCNQLFVLGRAEPERAPT